MQNEVNSLKMIIGSTLKEIHKLQNEKKELLTINFTITNELNQVKIAQTNSSSNRQIFF